MPYPYLTSTRHAACTTCILQRLFRTLQGRTTVIDAVLPYLLESEDASGVIRGGLIPGSGAGTGAGGAGAGVGTLAVGPLVLERLALAPLALGVVGSGWRWRNKAIEVVYACIPAPQD